MKLISSYFVLPPPPSSLSPFSNPGTMPKERRSRASIDRPSPFPSRSSDHLRRHSSKDLKKKEWDEILCPVCMDHPHNAVLLLCSSRKKGCRPFMCNTSHRHSNCLDQYRRAFSASVTKTPAGSKPKLSCPLCRGSVSGWNVVGEARKYMNAKARNCSAESCGFKGDYDEIRRHGRKEHPLISPSEADPERQQDWQRMEQERDLDDVYSALQSVFDDEEEEDVVEDLGSWLPDLISSDLI